MLLHVKPKQNRYKWLAVGLLAVLVAAPNGAVVKHSLGSMGPEFFNVLRCGALVLAITPYVWRRRSTLNKQALRYALLSGLCMSVAMLSYVWALESGEASYVAILSLITPIAFIFYAVKLADEKINRRTMAGVTLAALGAFTIVALPIALRQQGSFSFYPAATFFTGINILSYPLAIIFLKKAHTGKATLTTLLGVSSYVIFLVNLTAWLLKGAQVPQVVGPAALLGALYSGLIVALASRVLAVVSYEKLGAATNGALSYLENFLAILFPLLLLGERLSVEMAVGGILILAGVYVLEHHKHSHHKHFSFMRHH